MASPAMELDRPFNVRSISMPSRPQLVAIRVEEVLRKLKAYMASSTSFETPLMECSGLRGLGDLYDCMKDVVQHSLFNMHQKKWMEEELDRSIRILDLCTLVRDTLVAMKEHSQDLISAHRRKDGAPLNKLHGYTGLAKKAQKEIKKCSRLVNQKDKKLSKSFSVYDKNCDVWIMAKMFMEAREITISLLQSVIPSLSQLKIKSKESKWSFVSKASQQSKVAYEDELHCIREVEDLECLEIGLECLFKQLIQYRISLLNISL